MITNTTTTTMPPTSPDRSYEEFYFHYEKYLMGDLKTMIEFVDNNTDPNKNYLAVPIANIIFSFY